MKNIKTRSGVFETNSSSTHSLTLASTFENMVTSPVSDYEIKQGFITVYPGEYNWAEEEFNSIGEKLSYLYVDAMRGEDDKDVDPNSEFYRNSNFKLKMIEDAVKEYTGIGVVFEKSSDTYYPFGYIDHQSVGLCEEVWDDGTNGVIRFAFSNSSYFKTDNDNH